MRTLIVYVMFVGIMGGVRLTFPLRTRTHWVMLDYSWFYLFCR